MGTLDGRRCRQLLLRGSTAWRPAGQDREKGAEEGSETVLNWRACFAPCDGEVVAITDANITVRAQNGSTVRRGRRDLPVHVGIGDTVVENQIIASKLVPRCAADLVCRGGLDSSGIARMLTSRHLPVRFAGVRLARLLGEASLQKRIEALAGDPDEDLYVRLEAKSYLAAVCSGEVACLFEPDLRALDRSDRLEAVITLGEVGTQAAGEVLAAILLDCGKDYFLRSGAAYCLGQIATPDAKEALIEAFRAQAHRVREDALVALADVGFNALPELVAGVQHRDEAIQAGCAEAIRRVALQADIPRIEAEIAPRMRSILSRSDRSLLAVWLAGQLPEPLMQAALSQALRADERLAYSLAVSWAFARSWVAPLQDSFQKPRM